MKTSVMDVGRLLWALSGRGVEKQIAKLRGVKCAAVNYVTGSANVVYDQAVTGFEQMLVRSGIRLIAP
ncbi:MAG: hypothetical protein A2W81_01395 [Betaproteobacteria bacterium RIFCSPLOWO2_12_61_14]|nr:MAG: hypothetical protein A2W81_01395 [Betaproteobacteria bacterium RIFCSPLOWO2_12_61_14]